MTYREPHIPEHTGARIKSFVKLFVLMLIAFILILLILPYFDKYMLA